MTPKNPESALTIQVALMEFQKLRDEITSRSNNQATLISLTITASGLVVGFSISESNTELLLLILPILAPALGLLFVDHALTILRLGKHIDLKIAPVLRDLTGQATLMKHEEDIYKSRRQIVGDIFPFGSATLVLFNVVPIVSIVITSQFLGAAWINMVWTLGLVLTTIEASFMIHYIRTVTSR